MLQRSFSLVPQARTKKRDWRVDLDAELLIEEAAAASAVPPDDSDSYRPGLERFLAESQRSETLTGAGRAAVRSAVIDALAARFKIADWTRRNPEILDRPVERPLFILGMPRAGTTLLVNLLGLDQRRRMYWHWEGNREIPPAEIGHRLDDPRIARRVAEVDAGFASGALDPHFHVEMGDEPTECFWPLAQDFKAYPWLVQTQVPAYFEWLLNEADMVVAYRHHKRVLQVIQSRWPGRWTLKFPSHAAFLEALLTVYPDARIIMTHRDPAKPVGSTCSTCGHILSLNNSDIDAKRLGDETLRLLAASANRAMAARDAHPEVPFYDFHYRKFVADPLGEITRIYEFLGEDFTPSLETAMRAQLDQDRKRRAIHGEHRYRLEDYGLSHAALKPVFANYVERFGIEPEAH